MQTTTTKPNVSVRFEVIGKSSYMIIINDDLIPITVLDSDIPDKLPDKKYVESDNTEIENYINLYLNKQFAGLFGVIEKFCDNMGYKMHTLVAKNAGTLVEEMMKFEKE